MSPSESSLEAQRRTLDGTSTTLASQSRLALHSPSSHLVNRGYSVLFESTKRQTEVASMAAGVTPITKPSVPQTLTSSSISDVLQGTKYFTSKFNFTTDKKYSEMQDKATSSVPINAEGHVPKYLKDHISSLPSKNVFKPGYISPQILSSEAAMTSSHNSSSSDTSTVPYPQSVLSSVFQHQNPCPLSGLVLCKSLEEGTSEVAVSYQPPFSHLNAMNSSNRSSLASSGSLDVTSVRPQSEGHFEFSKSPVSIQVSKLSDNERRNSTKGNKIHKIISRPNSFLSSEPSRNSETPPSENSTFDSVNMSDSAFWKLWLFGDRTYRTQMPRNGSIPRTLTTLKSLSLVRSDKTATSRTLPSSAPRSVFRGNDSPDDLQRITVLGLFEMTTRTGERVEGRSELAAARLAVSHINEKRLLPGYQLELLTNDTKVISAVPFILYRVFTPLDILTFYV
jgi:hypothetical protein